MPLMSTVDDSPETMRLPQALVSFSRAAFSPSNMTSGEPDTIGFSPCPDGGQAVGL
jgi:hypothetical protein